MRNTGSAGIANAAGQEATDQLETRKLGGECLAKGSGLVDGVRVSLQALTTDCSFKRTELDHLPERYAGLWEARIMGYLGVELRRDPEGGHGAALPSLVFLTSLSSSACVLGMLWSSPASKARVSADIQVGLPGETAVPHSRKTEQWQNLEDGSEILRVCIAVVCF